ncbi:unnamed protein product [Didymodactylos carnosus]|uniref:Uncharacterized protein n=1 Tax=Didymodactylos carnosus TaxID=1234261 RepID=A0A813V5S9_9BILA|nr:unnamed protein product [Didymodactylos carnosus]CAF0837785.1 unnamed protein product [Didymodactylos carnosus]CAF3533230.1 unnamed protein product [Didymodactylos carnosus]CAF3625036.1 unnamed protein product [Didymodactylos carnosus]
MEKKVIDQIIQVTNDVYGKYDSSKWVPKSYTDNKSRYLWTDAFGVCNYLTLYHETNDQQYLQQADLLIKNVHDTLGYERTRQKRLDSATEEHPTKGGLRIGKIDEEGTHDGDGQYFHYLTKWAFALSRMSIAKKDPQYNDWAIELIKVIHPRFVYDIDTEHPHMYWKMRIDLKKPDVLSEGNLDPYDGFITYRLVQEVASADKKYLLDQEIKDMRKMVEKKYGRYRSNDPLDLGEALWITHWYPEEEWAKAITAESLKSLERLYQQGYFDEKKAGYRLAFREFGTTIGVQVCHPPAPSVWKERVQQLHSFWFSHLYKRDQDITPIMFCTSLNPGWIGFGVPDWQAFYRYSGGTQEYYGLWAYCQNQKPLFNSVCQRWHSAEQTLFNGSRPQFVRSAEGLITTGMILLTFGLVAAIVAALLPLLAYVAAVLALLAFIFLVIGLPIFARSANNLSRNRGDYEWNHRYGLWLIVPTIVLEFLAMVLWALAALLYQMFGYGTIVTGSLNKSRMIQGQGGSGSGQPMFGGGGLYSMRAPYNALGGLPMRPPPALLSQYMAQRPPQYYRPMGVESLSQNVPYVALPVVVGAQSSVLPQPSIVRAAFGPLMQTTTPAYIRPIVNLTGQTIVSPPRVTAAVIAQQSIPGTYVIAPGLDQPIKMIDMLPMAN